MPGEEMALQMGRGSLSHPMCSVGLAEEVCRDVAQTVTTPVALAVVPGPACVNTAQLSGHSCSRFSSLQGGSERCVCSQVRFKYLHVSLETAPCLGMLLQGVQPPQCPVAARAVQQDQVAQLGAACVCNGEDASGAY